MHGKSASEHNLSGVGCNIRVSRGNKTPQFLRVFQGLLAILAKFPESSGEFSNIFLKKIIKYRLDWMGWAKMLMPI